MISEDLLRKIKMAGMERSHDALQELCAALIRAGYSDPNLKDEDVDRIYAVVCRPETGSELRSDRWVLSGQGYRFLQFGHAKNTAKRQEGEEKIVLRLCVPTGDRVLSEWEVGDLEQEKALDKKIQDLKDYRKYLKMKKDLERLEGE